MVVFTLYEHGYILDWEYVFLCIIENIHFYVGYFNISNILTKNLLYETQKQSTDKQTSVKSIQHPLT